MNSKVMLGIAGSFLGLTFTLGQITVAQERGGGAPQPQGLREYTVAEIPGVVAAGTTWTKVWQGPDNADGLVGFKGGVIFAQEQPNHVGMVDKDDKYSVYLENTHGAGALAIDSKGRVFAAERTCTDPGGHPDQCTEPPAIGQIAPEQKVLATMVNGKSIGRPNDLIVDNKGGIYFTSGGAFYLSPSGTVSTVGENLRTNGIALSPDGKTLYITNGGTLVAFDVQPDGSVKNQRDFAKLEAGGAGDGSTVDSMGRIYVSSGPGVQVIGPDGKYLGVIATPRPVISVAFSGTDKKTLYMVGGGALGPDGTEFKTPQGVRNNAKTIFKISMQSEGFKGRAK